MPTTAWQTADAFVGSGPYVLDGTDGADLVLRANDALRGRDRRRSTRSAGSARSTATR